MAAASGTGTSEIHTEMKKDESKMTPWEVKGEIEYMKLIEKFGTNPIDPELIARWEKITKTKVHHMIRRGIVFSHQDITKILDNVEKGIPVYIYTGRGPSSESMHLGHLVPFVLTKYLQDALNCIVVIQMSDDEKFLFKDGSTRADLEYYHNLSRQNAKDIIAVGFDPDKTFIFSNLEFNRGELYANNIIISKHSNMNQIKGIYGLGESKDSKIESILEDYMHELREESGLRGYSSPNKHVVASIERYLKNPEQASSVGQCVWPAFQCGPAFCTSFKDIFSKAIHAKIEQSKTDGKDYDVLERVYSQIMSFDKKNEMMCLVPMAIDQAPYFRMARDVADKLGCEKPAVIHSQFLPPLATTSGKMSSSTGDSATLFLDMDSKKITKAIKKHAFSGGRATKEEHMEKGGDIRIDVAYQYLTFFMEDDNELRAIAEKYSSGEMLSGDLKKICADIVSTVISDHQEVKSTITDEVVATFFDSEKTLDIGGIADDREEIAEYDEVCGITFDRTFGFVPKSEME